MSTLPTAFQPYRNFPRRRRLRKLLSKERNRPSKYHKFIESYSGGPTVKQQFGSFQIVSRYLTKQNPDQPSLAIVLPLAISSLAATSSTDIEQRTQQVYRHSTFNVNPSSVSDFAPQVTQGSIRVCKELRRWLLSCSICWYLPKTLGHSMLSFFLIL